MCEEVGPVRFVSTGCALRYVPVCTLQEAKDASWEVEEMDVSARQDKNLIDPVLNPTRDTPQEIPHTETLHFPPRFIGLCV